MTLVQRLYRTTWQWIEGVLHYIVYRVLRINLSESNWQLLLQFVKFGIVGVSNTVISYLIYVGTLLVQQKYGLFPNIDYIISQVIAFLLSVLWSFYWNRIFVFEAKDISWVKALLKTYASYAFTGLILSNLMLVVWVQLLHISKLIAPIINLVFSIPINFLLNKYWSFGNERKKDASIK